MQFALKAIKPQNLIIFLKNYKGTPLPIKTVSLDLQNPLSLKGTHLRGQFVYKNFKTSFPQMLKMARLCKEVDCFGQIFNVYNKIVVEFHNEGIPTTKELITLLMMHQLFKHNAEKNQNINEISSKALKKFNELIKQ